MEKWNDGMMEKWEKWGKWGKWGKWRGEIMITITIRIKIRGMDRI